MIFEMDVRIGNSLRYPLRALQIIAQFTAGTSREADVHCAAARESEGDHWRCNAARRQTYIARESVHASQLPVHKYVTGKSLEGIGGAIGWLPEQRMSRDLVR